MASGKGIFIVFEGIDGCGKGTHLHLAAEHLRLHGVPAGSIVETAEPTKSKAGQRIRELLKKGSAKSNAGLLLKLYLEDRKQHIKRVIEPALESGKIVLCDRYKHSTLAYQCAQGIAAKRVIEMHSGMPLPGLVIVLDLPVGEAIERISADGLRPAKEKFERAAFLKKVRAYYRRMQRFFPKERFVYINSSGTIGSVSKKVLQAVDAEVMGF